MLRLITSPEPSHWLPIPEPEAAVQQHRGSKALIASNDGNGVVLAYTGTTIESEIDDCIGSHDITDLGLDDAPDGLSVWVGEFETMADGDGEFSSYARGEFRDLTPFEWKLLASGKSIFVDG